MPYMTNGKRDYKKELDWEHEQSKKRVKDRAARNKARKEAGLKVGDPRQADHKKPLDSAPRGRNKSLPESATKKSNVQVVSAKANADKEVKRKRSKPGNN
jgi:hypothetical protein